MRLQILTFLFSLIVFVLATGKLDDKANIKDALTIFNLHFDKKEYNKLGNVLAKNVTIEVTGERPIQGLANAIKFFSKIKQNDTVSYTASTNVLIEFLGPFNEDGRSTRAVTLSSAIVGFFRRNDSEYIFAEWKDLLIKTEEPGLDGWRFADRDFKEIGEAGNRKLLG